jgi:hypothetical protein
MECSIPKGNDRTLNIQEIFETTIFWMPDICKTYDHYYSMAERHKKWYQTKYHLHEKTKRITIAHLIEIYEQKTNKK